VQAVSYKIGKCSFLNNERLLNVDKLPAEIRMLAYAIPFLFLRLYSNFHSVNVSVALAKTCCTNTFPFLPRFQ
jgi:hypothetical protein